MTPAGRRRSTAPAPTPTARSAATRPPSTPQRSGSRRTLPGAGRSSASATASRTGTAPMPGLSSNYDRNLYMTNAGTLIYGVYVNGTRTVTLGSSVQRRTPGTMRWRPREATACGSTLTEPRSGRLPNQTAAQSYWGSWKDWRRPAEQLAAAAHEQLLRRLHRRVRRLPQGADGGAGSCNTTTCGSELAGLLAAGTCTPGP